MKNFFVFIFALAAMINFKLKENTVSGVVIDQNQNPIFGVTILEKGTQNGTLTDFDGKFTLQMTDVKHLLEVNLVGYEKLFVKPIYGKKMTIVIRPTTDILEEIVVLGTLAGSKV
ncbi:MAG TPA: carboxypeptidase-like regulatory domain-containing protein, partial [Saprospiraceae bacterium]|nr:carboxypeptidase-like regulatory domain-containing protein [Saprospiraceae bacterium]